MKKFFALLLGVLLASFINFYYDRSSKPSHFVVTPDTKIDPNSELAKYVTQEEIDDFAFRYWDIDEYDEANATLNDLRNLLRLKNTDKILDYMKQNNLSANLRMKANTTPLMYACFYNDVNTAKELVKEGADINATDKFKLTPIAYAIENNSTKAVKFLLSKKVKFDSKALIQRYLQSPQHDMIKHITINGDNISVEYESKYEAREKGSKDGIYPFVYVAFSGFTEILQMLLDEGYRYNDYELSHDLTYMPDYKPTLEILLKYNAQKQPSNEELKEAYNKCYQAHKEVIEDKFKYIDAMNEGIDRVKEKRITDKYIKNFSDSRVEIERKLIQEGIIVRKPIPLDPDEMKEYDTQLAIYEKYCPIKNFKFEELKSYNDLWAFEKRKPDENETFMDVKSYIEWSNKIKINKEIRDFKFRHLDSVFLVDKNMTQKEYLLFKLKNVPTETQVEDIKYILKRYEPASKNGGLVR